MVLTLINALSSTVDTAKRVLLATILHLLMILYCHIIALKQIMVMVQDIMVGMEKLQIIIVLK